jgi:hypothetical protein
MSKTFDTIKNWVVMKASVTNPYKKYWSASVTIFGMDVNGIGSTIEKAYCDLTANLMLNREYRTVIENKMK